MIQFGWVRSSWDAMTTFISQTTTPLQNAYRYLRDNQTLTDYSSPWSHGVSAGIQHTYAPGTREAMTALKETRPILRQSVSGNVVLYMGTMLAYELMLKFTILNTFPDLKDSRTEATLDWLAWAYMMRLSASMLLDNSIYNVCITRSLSHEVDNSTAMALPKGDGGGVQADALSPLFYYSKIATAHVVKRLPLGEYLSPWVFSLAYGESLLEYNFSQLSSEQREEYFLKVQPYSLGLGMAFMGANLFWRGMIKAVTGVDNAFVEDAIFSATFQYFMVLARMIKRPLPVFNAGLDIFYYGRLMTKDALAKVLDAIIVKMNTPGDAIDWQDFASRLHDNVPLLLLMKIMLSEDVRTLEHLVQRPSVQLLLAQYGDTIHDFLREAIRLRHTTYVHYIPNWLVPQDKRLPLRIILAKEMDGVFEKIDAFIRRAQEQAPIIRANPKTVVQALRTVQEEYQPVTTTASVPVEMPVPVASPAPSAKPATFMPTIIEDYEGNAPLSPSRAKSATLFAPPKRVMSPPATAEKRMVNGPKSRL